MPTEKEIEGKVYVLKSEVDDIVRDRLSEVTRQRNEANDRIKVLEKEAGGSAAKVKEADGLAAQVTELRERLAQADARYERYVAMSERGISDPDIIASIEGALDRVNAKSPKGEKLTLDDAMDAWSKDPAKAPSSVRHHFQSETADTDTDTDTGKGAEVAETKGKAGEGKGTEDATAKTGARVLPKQVAKAGAKPSPTGRSLTADEIFAADDKQLDDMVADFKGSRAAPA